MRSVTNVTLRNSLGEVFLPRVFDWNYAEAIFHVVRNTAISDSYVSVRATIREDRKRVTIELQVPAYGDSITLSSALGIEP